MYSNLSCSNNMIIQPVSLKTELMQHQKTAIYSMLELEQNGKVEFKMTYYDNEEKNLLVKTKVGILGDKVGSGKTLVIISLIMDNKIPPETTTQYSSNMFTSIHLKNNEIFHKGCNLILLPMTLENQWTESFVKFSPEIKYEVFDPSSKNIMNYSNLDVVIVTNKNIEQFSKLHKNIKWKRIIIDEADTFKMKGKFSMDANFFWLVTGTPNKIVYSKLKYLSDIFGSNKTWIPEYISVKNDDNFIKESMNLPTPNRHIINCFTPTELKYIKEYIPKSIVNMINAGNTKNAIKALGCNVDTHDNIFGALTYKYELIKKDKIKELDKINKKWKKNKQKYQKEKNSIEKIIERSENRIKAIKSKIYEMKKDICPFCMGKFNKPTIVSCCGSVYCFECLAIMMQKNNKCPSCFKVITKNMINILNKKSIHNNNKDTRKEKIDALIDIIEQNPSGKFLVFANYPATLNLIKNKLTDNKIGKDILGGTLAKVTSTLKKFKENKLKVIILNASNFGAGLNIQDATDIIIYHRFDKELEEQVIGRAQRYGREGTLNVYYLIHDNETTDFMETSKFDFNDENEKIDLDLDSDSDTSSNSDSNTDTDSDSDVSSD